VTLSLQPTSTAIGVTLAVQDVVPPVVLLKLVSSPSIALTEQDASTPFALTLGTGDTPPSVSLSPQDTKTPVPITFASDASTVSLAVQALMRGPQGASGGLSNVDEFVATVGGTQTRTYETAPSASTMVFINGLRQSGSSFSITNTSITLPSTLNIEIGDLIQVEY